MIHANLNEIRSLGHLLAFCVDDLDWPIDPDANVEDMTFDYSADELAVDAAALADVKVKRLRPITPRQPWGILVIDFGKKKLSVTTIRKVLRSFVRRKRQDAKADRPLWALEHLLFICLHHGDEGRAMTFVNFEQPTAAGSLPRLTSFGWTEHSHNRTVLEFNISALRWPDDPSDSDAWIAKWLSAFDVEKVTKRFFDDYETVFHSVESKVKGVKTGEPLRLYTQRLFNRLLFIYFIQRKGWLSFEGNKNYLRAIYDRAVAGKEDFLNDRLYWTFFYGLNTLSEGKKTHSQKDLEERRGTVPFLNGGLFDLEDDYDVQGAVTIPNAAFGEILALFERYNFTVEESTPLDVEVAVDPEMLGKVFEKLVTGRHESGSYYTPRTVVSFMAREALKHYLAAAEPDAAAVAKFVDAGDASGLRNPDAIYKSLTTITICDPACGSGAFLLGTMQELLRLRDALFVVHKKDHRAIYDRKLEIIRTSLYGVDLDEFAVNIAKLRLWLSLAVEYAGRDTPPALPNLDFKIERGDSLTGPNPSAMPDLFREKIYALADQLVELKANYLTAHGAKKKSFRFEIVEREKKIAFMLSDGRPADDRIEWRVNFAEVFKRGGFDLVIGNPPYVRQEQIKELKPALKPLYVCYTGVADLYVYFYERGISLLKPGGQFAFITSNKWYRAGYGEKLRDWLARKTTVHAILDFGDAAVFEAIAYPTVVLLERTIPTSSTTFQGYTWQPGPRVDTFAETFRAEAFAIPQSSLAKTGWRFECDAKRKLLDKLRAAGTPLGEYCQGRFYRGILTGFNDAFIVDRVTRDRLIKEHKSSEAVLKPFLRGRDVKRWRVEPKDLWLIFTRRGIDSKKYPAILEHLKPFKKGLMPGGPGGRKPGSYEWYEIQDNIAYWKEFEAPKIIVPAITGNVNYAIDDQCYFANNKSTIFVTDKNHYVSAICNSPVSMWLVRQTFASKQGGFFDFEPRYSSTVPIPNASTTDQTALEKLVLKIIKLKESNPVADVGDLEAEINERVYRLFGLTADEVKLVEEAKS